MCVNNLPTVDVINIRSYIIISRTTSIWFYRTVAGLYALHRVDLYSYTVYVHDLSSVSHMQ